MSGGYAVTEYDGPYGGAGAWPYGGPPGVGAALPSGAAGPGGLPPARHRSPLRRRRVLVAVAAAVVVALAGTTIAVAHGDRAAAAGTPRAHPRASAGASAAASAADVAGQDAAARGILDRRAAALLHGSLTGWLAEVDPRQPALVAQQRMLFANLRRLPLSLFRFGPYQGVPR